MRINPEQTQIICKQIHKYLGDSAAIWLFGSRVIDNTRGGDVTFMSKRKVFMRLTENQRQSIKSAVTRVIGEGTRIWLFGSRADDSKRGGDIDLLIETETVVPSRVGALVVRLGNRKIDVLLKDAPTADTPITLAARKTGVLL